MNYQSIGSGAGIKQIQSKTVTFGASDMPLKPRRIEKSRLRPVADGRGRDVPVVNLEGVKSGELELDGETLAKIYPRRDQAKWDDPAITKFNPSAKLPSSRDRRRAPFGRIGHDLHLDRLSFEGQRRLEVEGRLQHGGRVAGRDRRQGQRRRRQQRRQTKGAIGYVEYAYAKQNKMTYRAWSTRPERPCSRARQRFKAAAANADWRRRPGYYVILTDQPGATSWPIAGCDLHPDPHPAGRIRRLPPRP